MKTKLVPLILVLLTGCMSQPKKEIAPIVDNSNLELVKPAKAVPKARPQLQAVEFEEKGAKNFGSTGELLEVALEEARQKPEYSRFLNATTKYDYIPGSVYQVYTAPLKVTMLSFEQGEKLVSLPQGGDTARWQLSTINSGVGSDSQQHLVIKPLREGLKNNLILTTNKGRKYFIETISFKNSYMAEVAWNYPQKPKDIAVQAKPKKPEAPVVVNTCYKVSAKRGKPSWRPTAVYDNGAKTFIQLAAQAKRTEIPALYIVTRETNSQLVNYRMEDNLLVVDRLFDKAELRLGLKKPEVVTITRKSNG